MVCFLLDGKFHFCELKPVAGDIFLREGGASSFHTTSPLTRKM